VLREVTVQSDARRAILPGLFALLAPLTAAGQQLQSSDARHTLADLAFMTGEWVIERAGERLEEYWSVPTAGSMFGVFRWERNGRLWLNELMTIVAEPDGPVFRLRHFDAAMRPWEKEDETPFVYPLVKLAAAEAVFENEARDAPRRFRFSRPEPDVLVIVLEGVTTSGEPTRQEFRFTKRR
jgi:hypothetical protein